MPAGLPAAVLALVTELRKLPGVGEKTATRYVLSLMQRGPDGLAALGEALGAVAGQVRPCSRCGFLADAELCGYCADPTRDPSLVCVVEGIADLVSFLASERANYITGEDINLSGGAS